MKLAKGKLFFLGVLGLNFAVTFFPGPSTTAPPCEEGRDEPIEYGGSAYFT